MHCLLASFLQSDEGIQSIKRFKEGLQAHAHSDSIAPENLDDFVLLPIMVVFAEWANLEGANQPDDKAIAWLNRIKDTNHLWIPGFSGEWGPGIENHGMPFMTSQWVFPIKREYEMPYDKRTYVTNATNLDRSGWVDFTTRQINDICLNWLKYGIL